MSLTKVETSGSTVYFIDEKEGKFLRVKGSDSPSNMWRDGTWVDYMNEPTIEVGEHMFFTLARPFGAWQRTSRVKTITRVNDTGGFEAPSESL